ncbi:MAG: threonine ammonia-lyase, biosynthetic [Fimbriimonadaceae bacterium]
MVPLVELKDVSVYRDGKAILDHVSLSVGHGEHIAVVGPNGAGKTTLVKLMTRELHPHAGRGVVRIDGEGKSPVREVRVALAAVSPDQDSWVLGDPSAKELVLSGFFGTFGVTFGHLVGPDEAIRADLVMAMMEIQHLSDRPISTLSTGERKRAWIARALAPEPKALVLDEPTSNLDTKIVGEFRWLMRRIAESGVTLILVTHRFDEIIPEIKRVILLRKGRVFDDGPRESVMSQPNIDALFAGDVGATKWKSPVTPREYLAAMRQVSVYDVAILSPLEYAPALSALTANNVWLKREDRQPVFSFKLRGAYALMSNLPPELLARGVIAASAGNHAQGVALSAKRLGTQATIVVPRTTPSIKTDAIQQLGADLILYGDTYDEAYERALEIGKERELTFVHPYDQPAVIAGQGTVGLEIIEQMAGNRVDAVFVPVGGGGLVSGVALAVKQLSRSTKVIGVEPEDSDAMHRSLLAGERVTLDRVGRLADGVAVRTVGKLTFEIARKWVDEIVVVSNDEICGAVKEIFEDRRAILEPSGALAFAGLKRYVLRDEMRGKNLVAIASGANLNFDRLRYVAERAAVGEGREAMLAVTIPEVAGSFRRFCQALGQRAITEFNYRMGSAKCAHVFVGVSTKSDAEHRTLVSDLEQAGYGTLDLTGDELATMHLRHMVGGRSVDAAHERLLTVDFPERPGALGAFLERLGESFNISLFHYRNHGSDLGRVLVGFQVPPGTEAEFERFRSEVGYASADVTENAALGLFLR